MKKNGGQPYVSSWGMDLGNRVRGEKYSHGQDYSGPERKTRGMVSLKKAKIGLLYFGLCCIIL